MWNSLIWWQRECLFHFGVHNLETISNNLLIVVGTFAQSNFVVNAFLVLSGAEITDHTFDRIEENAGQLFGASFQTFVNKSGYRFDIFFGCSTKDKLMRFVSEKKKPIYLQ